MNFTMEELELLEDGLYELFSLNEENLKISMKLEEIHNKIVRMRQELGSKKAVQSYSSYKRKKYEKR